MEADLEVDFSHSGIEEVPHLVYPNAIKISLRRNRIKSLPETDNLSSLPCLTKLDLYDNLHSKIPKCLSKLEQLKWLDLSFNLIDCVPKGSLPAGVEHLYLTANRLTEIPYEALQELPRLKVLELGANQIKSIANVNLSFELLEELWLSGNQISNTITNNCQLNFSQLPKLKILSLQCNKLVGSICINEASLNLPNSIEELHLGENKISQFELQMQPKNQPPALPKLPILDLGHNELISVSENIRLNCPELEDFWVNDNKICSLEQTLKVVQNI